MKNWAKSCSLLNLGGRKKGAVGLGLRVSMLSLSLHVSGSNRNNNILSSMSVGGL